MRHIASRLHLVPRYRQKVVWPPLGLGRPSWVDDPCFNLDYHLRHTALPRPGSIEQLQQLAARIYSQRLDRDKPLWEIWLVDGLKGDRAALISKTHHAMIDGMSGVDILSILFDVSPDAPQQPPGSLQPWEPSNRSPLRLGAEALTNAATIPAILAKRAVGAVAGPTRAAGRALEGAAGVRDMLLYPLLSPAPPTPLNVSIGPHRRMRWVTFRLDDFKAIKNSLGGTINDVVLAVVAGALRAWLAARNERISGLQLRAMVPVSIRADAEKYQFGNRVAAMRGPLPVFAEDPAERYGLVREAMRGLKGSKQAVGAETLTNLQEFAPPTLLAQAARINFSTRLFNLIVTNVPGPQFPIFLLGRQMTEMIPMAFLPENHALAVAIMSYNGTLSFGLLGDRDALPDLDRVAEAVQQSFEELIGLARPARHGALSSARAPMQQLAGST
jgi:WS/DGAT/MGAT family acyltransferase